MALSSFLLTGCYETGSADKIGTIVKVGNGQGIFCKTIEAEIIRGGFSGGTGASGQSFHFTIESPEMAAKLRVAMDTQQEVKIKYHTEMASFCRSDSESTFLDSFEIVEKTPKTQASPTGVANSAIVGANARIVELLKVQAQLIEEIAAEQVKVK